MQSELLSLVLTSRLTEVVSCPLLPERAAKGGESTGDSPLPSAGFDFGSGVVCWTPPHPESAAVGLPTASAGEVSALGLVGQGGLCLGVRMPEPAEPTCSEVCNVSVHHPWPLVSVSVLEVLPIPARACECSL